ncbi:MAG: RNA 2',3'-cyclic phosphodiesterase [Thermodesulfobacteriota bacterium]|nr:RNA 2',3'-cyclic phosphodiesterase [Thermodesulfobacteriota bacterium]
MTDEKLIRTFLAIELPEEIKVQIGNIQNRLKVTVKGVRWTRPEGIHLTLKFFGNVSENDIVNISRIVEKNTIDVRPLTLNVSTVGTFPNFKRPRVLWLGISGSVERLSDLQKEIENDLESIGFQRENRVFRAHLTLGRVKPPKDVKGLSEIIKSEESYDAGSFRAGGLTLFKSDLTPQGAIYTKLAYFPFDG